MRFLITLNYDLSVTNALSELGAEDQVEVIDGPDEYHRLAGANVVFLHRSVTAPPEDWVLRTASLNDGWRETWQEVAAQVALSTPEVVLAGLGTAVGVVIESATRIRAALPTASITQVDPGEFGASPYVAALGLTSRDYVRLGWTEFMEVLGRRLVAEHVNDLIQACDRMIRINGWFPEDLDTLRDRFLALGLIDFGYVRSAWLACTKRYEPHHAIRPELVGDLALVIATIERELGLHAEIDNDGLVTFWEDKKRVAVAALRSGGGYQRWAAVGNEVAGAAGTATFAIVSGFTGAQIHSAAPDDIVRGDREDSILSGPVELPVLAVDDVRADPRTVSDLLEAA